MRIDTASFKQIKEGLSQVSSVIQMNAATAEENSAASEEMSAQAVVLRSEIEKFKLKDNYKKVEGKISLGFQPQELLIENVDKSVEISGLGKY